MADDRLLETLWRIAAIDHHAHGVLPVRPSLDEFRGMFSESPDPAQWPHVRNGASYRFAIRELAELLGCEASEEAVRRHRLDSDFDEYAGRLLAASGIAALLLDDGYPPPGEGHDAARMGALAGHPTHRVMRIERVAEEALDGSLHDLRDHVTATVAGARAAGAVGLKTIAAYRTGLDVAPPDRAGAADALAASSGRLDRKALLELVLWDALEANAADPLPVQVHCGFGDSDLLLPRADPSWLKPVFERFRGTPFVLLHCYPFVREAGWLAHVYGNVFFDLSLTIPHVARPAAAVREALELAPFSKLLFATDAARTPELYYVSALRWRRALAAALPRLFPGADVEEAGRAILRENALALYRLEGAVERPLGTGS